MAVTHLLLLALTLLVSSTVSDASLTLVDTDAIDVGGPAVSLVQDTRLASATYLYVSTGDAEGVVGFSLNSGNWDKVPERFNPQGDVIKALAIAEGTQSAIWALGSKGILYKVAAGNPNSLSLTQMSTETMLTGNCVDMVESGTFIYALCFPQNTFSWQISIYSTQSNSVMYYYYSSTSATAGTCHSIAIDRDRQLIFIGSSGGLEMHKIVAPGVLFFLVSNNVVQDVEHVAVGPSDTVYAVSGTSWVSFDAFTGVTDALTLAHTEECGSTLGSIAVRGVHVMVSDVSGLVLLFDTQAVPRRQADYPLSGAGGAMALGAERLMVVQGFGVADFVLEEGTAAPATPQAAPTSDAPVTAAPVVPTMAPATDAPTAVPTAAPSAAAAPTAAPPTPIPAADPTPAPGAAPTPAPPLPLPPTAAPATSGPTAAPTPAPSPPPAPPRQSTTPTPATAPASQQEASTAAAATAAVASAVSMSGSGSAMRLVLAGVQCRGGARLPFALHPTGWAPWGSAAAGVVAENSAACAAVLLLAGLLVRIAQATPRATARHTDIAGLLRFPSVPLLAFQLLYQGLTLGGAMLLFDADTAGGMAAGSAVLLVCCAVPLWATARTRHDVPRHARVVPAPGRGRLARALLGTGEWEDVDPRMQWVNRYASVSRAYREGAVWYVAADFASSLALSLAKAVPVRTGHGCGHIHLVSGLLLLGSGASVACFLPHLRLRDSAAEMVVAWLQGTALLLRAAGYYSGGVEGGRGWVPDLSSALLMMSGVLLAAKAVLDVAAEVVKACGAQAGEGVGGGSEVGLEMQAERQQPIDAAGLLQTAGSSYALLPTTPIVPLLGSAMHSPCSTHTSATSHSLLGGPFASWSRLSLVDTVPETRCSVLL